MNLRLRIPSNAKVTQTPPSKFVKDNSLYVLDQNDNLLFAVEPPVRSGSWSWRLVPSKIVAFGRNWAENEHPGELILIVFIDLEKAMSTCKESA